MARGGSPAEFSVAGRNGVREILKDGTVVMDDGSVYGSAQDAYLHLAGEAEARRVANRTNLTRAERRENFPLGGSDPEIRAPLLVRFQNAGAPAVSLSSGGLSPEGERQYDAVVARYANPDGTKKPGWMRAPNGRPTNLTERQWVQANTPNFRANFFGFYNLPKHEFSIVQAEAAPFNSTQGALEWAEANGVVGLMGADETNGKGEISISASSVREMLNPSQRGKSVSDSAHYAALAKLRDIIRESELADRHPDYVKGKDGRRSPENGVNPGVTIDVLYGALRFGGEAYRVKTTLKRFAQADAKTKAYAYEVSEIEVLTGTLVQPETGPDPRASTSITGDILLQGVRNSKGKLILDDFSKVVDENGEPLVVSHSTNADFTVFRDKQKNDAGWLGAGFYFFGDRSLDGQYGRNIMECFLNVRDPYFISDEEHGCLVEADDPDVSNDFSDEVLEDGHDGVFWNGDLNREWAVFDPNQVKSATGNSGGFSPDPDIFWFSRGAESSRNADVDLRRLVAGMEPLGHTTVGDAKVMEAARAIADDPARLRALASNVRSGSQKSVTSEERVALQIGDQRVFYEYASLADSLAEALSNGNVAQADVTLVHGF